MFRSTLGILSALAIGLAASPALADGPVCGGEAGGGVCLSPEKVRDVNDCSTATAYSKESREIKRAPLPVQTQEAPSTGADWSGPQIQINQREAAGIDEVHARSRQLLEKERRSGGGPPVVETRGWFPTEPEALAVELDRIAAALRRPPGLGEEPPASADELRLPGDLRPDRVEESIIDMARGTDGTVTEGEVATWVGFSPEEASQTLNRMAAKGLAERTGRTEWLIKAVTARKVQRSCPYCGASLPVRERVLVCPQCGGNVDLDRRE